MNQKERYDPTLTFEYENGFYATASASRLSKFVTHLKLFEQTSNIPGEIVECGIFRGNSFFRWIKFRALLENTYSRKVIGFDVFGDFPEAEFVDDLKQRELFVDETGGGRGIELEELESLLENQGLAKNVTIVKGDVIQTIPDFLKNHPELKISLLHLDLDLFEPTDVALKSFFPYVSKGGIIILDDYGAFAGANKAIDDYLKGEYKILKLPFSNSISYIVK